MYMLREPVGYISLDGILFLTEQGKPADQYREDIAPLKVNVLCVSL